MKLFTCALLVTLIWAAAAQAQECGRRNNYSGLQGIFDDATYVVGGAEAIKNEFPWQISLQVFGSQAWWLPKSWQHICGGSILNDRWIVTAAHCVIAPASSYRVVVGAKYPLKQEDTTQRIPVDQIVSHPGWSMETVSNDIAVMQLSAPIKLSAKSAAPVCLPNASDKFEGVSCTTSGWGRLYQNGPASDVLMKVDLPIVANDVCLSRYRDVFNAKITDDKICAGRLDTFGFGVCQGDSGGPLMCLKNGVYQLAGVTSFGVVCGSNTHPAVYTRVSSYLSWLNGIINKK